MSPPEPAPVDPAPGSSEPADPVPAGPRLAAAGRTFPGGRVVAVATLAVTAVALLEVATAQRVGAATGAALVVVAALASWVTRAGDRSLPAMMPPLAFLVAAVVAGQGLVTENSWRGQAEMLLGVLGANAGWVIAATAVAIGTAVLRRQVDR